MQSAFRTIINGKFMVTRVGLVTGKCVNFCIFFQESLEWRDDSQPGEFILSEICGAVLECASVWFSVIKACSFQGGFSLRTEDDFSVSEYLGIFFFFHVKRWPASAKWNKPYFNPWIFGKERSPVFFHFLFITKVSRLKITSHNLVVQAHNKK